MGRGSESARERDRRDRAGGGVGERPTRPLVDWLVGSRSAGSGGGGPVWREVSTAICRIRASSGMRGCSARRAVAVGAAEDQL